MTFLEHERPRTQNHWPALSLAFIAQAEALLAGEDIDHVDDVFVSFPPAASAGAKVVNTLNLVGSACEYKLRPFYNAALEVIRVEMRRAHPSNSAHATQSWREYRPLIQTINEATPGERAALAEYIWTMGVLNADERILAKAATRVVRPFEYTLAHMDTHNAKPGGALFQALVFGYFRADSPNLTLESHSVNTGSSRADMIGDVAGFRGAEVELAIEVKDYEVNEASVESVLGDFLEDIAAAPNATAVVVAESVTPEAATILEESNVIALSREDLRSRVITWDLPKQQEALRGADYYLGRIQKSPSLQARLSNFLEKQGLAIVGLMDTPGPSVEIKPIAD